MRPTTKTTNEPVMIENETVKQFSSPDYNYIFNKKDGLFLRWGKTKEEDPQFSPFGPEILDLEISVNGCPNNCKFCYKNNSNVAPTNMTLDTFKKILGRMPKYNGIHFLTQIAFGITGVQTNPDFLPMMEYARSQGIIPNFTLSGIDLTDELAERIAKVTGALAVSAYSSNKNICYDTVKKFTDLGVEQTNIHLMVSQETLDFVYQVLSDRETDPRLAKMRAIVLLSLKQKGRGGEFTPISQEDFTKLVKFALESNHPIGFDSCGANKFLVAIKDRKDYKQLEMLCEPCESSLFSSYINVDGDYCPCSFAEGCVTPSNVLNSASFLDIWSKNLNVLDFRKSLLAKARNCPLYSI